ncbi:enoyl-CoA hydratase/carnithine racemase [Desulfosporosinus orientis DSM 765]|uniref:short-chain-enoyl-CoA hydratase n=1 Tax=Desulfosporosinus orientis (strain ATCC 19365 / DSM 765 / NCIMB 8382 / VKM B-1628 / Singapore I) TaxID=768706 RepID=G7WCW6_DESOD|nr:enoyl-CoA hydratase-related protein [Desulfosporosinus orientis]AET66872.1 enoyl-CoA hydratase/carnithine racemase [Desulfosporosinus orientis DSM 765]
MNGLQLLTVDIKDHIACVTMNRPPVNALNNELAKELSAAFLNLKNDPEVRVIVITSSRKVFVAGADIVMMKGIIETKALGEMLDFDRRLQFANSILEDMPKPTIAVINGHSMGGGTELALFCDFRFIAETATIGLPEINLGLLPGSGGIQKIVRLIGRTKALRLMLQGNALSAQEAFNLGLVEEVCAAENLMDSAMQLARNLAQRAPVAVAEIKKCVNAALELERDSSLAYDVRGLGKLFVTEDAGEGLKAFLEKRPAVFKGF